MATSIALARKWRPKSFKEMVGQEHVVRALNNAIESGRIHHAYLFTGTRGVGKTTLARILAKCFNCETGLTAIPCGQCESCQSIDRGRNPDLMEVDAATNTRVEEMRELLDNAQYMPVAARYKVYIIDEVHMLSRSAFNSMLKTLEEPPEHVKFILATTDPQKVPITVLSRCLQFNLKQMRPEQIALHLGHILKEEQIAYEDNALTLIGRAAQGSMRDSLSLLDQAIAYSSSEVREEHVANMLGVISEDYLYQILNALSQQDAYTLIAISQSMADRYLSFVQALEDLARLIHNVTLLKATKKAQDTLGLSDSLLPLTESWDAQTLQLLYQIAIQARHDMYLAPDELSGFRMALLRMLAFTHQDAALPVSHEIKSENSKKKQLIEQTHDTAPSRSEKQIHIPPSLANWPELVTRLSGAGMAYELSRHCQLKSFEAGHLYLTIDPSQKTLIPYQDRLQSALESILDMDIKLTIELIKEEGHTPAQLEEKKEQAALQAAKHSIEHDPLVRTLLDEFGGKLIESSIKPIKNN
ncbi:DNA polymerase III subunit gamma/tau [Ferrovum sp. PN-J185]|uniref:DNA polymerase III subunit gamma/tau n=1 Tax=Ferrovum sp. PN-J185 TaxID=1356306 RepID=UPI001E4429E1|nr:DNA polymerase III subunit gamma/tau [Ferrovum sp. PN-J185]MCC6068578.1 DNA polymerase III subunit gamma/tau [Ferrovum sp. PN-J185]